MAKTHDRALKKTSSIFLCRSPRWRSAREFLVCEAGWDVDMVGSFRCVIDRDLSKLLLTWVCLCRSVTVLLYSNATSEHHLPRADPGQRR
jgi:hypothetical protein